jgi:hypothetical protein
MEGDPDSSYRFRNLLPKAMLTLLPCVAVSELVIVDGALYEARQARQSEHVVELLQEAHGPESVIADQWAEAASHRDAAEWAWGRGAALLGGYLLVASARTGLIVWRRGRREQEPNEATES